MRTQMASQLQAQMAPSHEQKPFSALAGLLSLKGLERPQWRNALAATERKRAELAACRLNVEVRYLSGVDHRVLVAWEVAQLQAVCGCELESSLHGSVFNIPFQVFICHSQRHVHLSILLQEGAAHTRPLRACLTQCASADKACPSCIQQKALKTTWKSTQAKAACNRKL